MLIVRAYMPPRYIIYTQHEAHAWPPRHALARLISAHFTQGQASRLLAVPLAPGRYFEHAEIYALFCLILSTPCMPPRAPALPSDTSPAPRFRRDAVSATQL